MNLVVISTCDPIDQYVISKIAEEFPIKKLIRPVWSGTSKKKSLVEKLKRFTPKKMMGRVRSIIYQPIRQRMYESIVEQLFGSDGFDLGIDTHDISRSQLNRESTAKLLRELETDVLLVSGAPILRERIFTAAPIAANLHYGIAPAYRGTNTVFWPLYYRDYDQIGVTLHHIDRGTDTGRTIAQAFPELEATDNEASLSAKNARVAAKAARQFLAAVEAGISTDGIAQQGASRTFFFRDRKLLSDVRYEFGKRLLGQHPPARPERIVTHFEECTGLEV